jgi:hypothetical protein
VPAAADPGRAPGGSPAVDRLVERLAVSRFDSSPADLQAMPKDDGPSGGARDRVMLANHQRANRFAIAEAEVDVRDGRFEARLAVPEKPPWPKLILRAYAFTERAEGLGVRKLAVGKR